MGKTSIEWTDFSWNPIRARNLTNRKVGWHCEHVSEGCRNCYAESLNRYRGTGLDFKPGHRADVEIFLDEKMLLSPLHWKQPRRIFVNSMSDTFAEFVTDEWLDRMFAVMALAPQHTFQCLTKRPQRMRAYMSSPGRFGMIVRSQQHYLGTEETQWPLRNCWLGTSAEDQPTADERIPELIQTLAAVRFVSLEPLLGPIDIGAVKTSPTTWLDVINREWPERFPHGSGIDLVIVGGESGPHARPMNPQWAREIRDQCQACGVAFFHKQNGEYASVSEVEGEGAHFTFPDGRTVRRVGKKAAGRRLDGVEWNQMPGERS